MREIPIDPSGVVINQPMQKGVIAAIESEGRTLADVLKEYKANPDFAHYKGRDWMFFRRGWWRKRAAGASDGLLRAMKYMTEAELEGLATDMRALSKKYLGYEGLSLKGELIGADDDEQ